MSQQPETSAPTCTLQVKFSWTDLKSIITNKDDPKSRPIYIVDYKSLTPTFIFRSGADNSAFASGTLHAISINADCNIRGQPITLNALKRFRTKYTYLSRAFSDTDSPVPMTWTATCNFKTWDFICRDPQQKIVAKFSSNIWALKKFAVIEIFGLKAADDAAVEEIVVTGTTVYTCMVFRATNILSIYGALSMRPGLNISSEATSKDAVELVASQDKSHLNAEGKRKYL